MIYCTNHLKKGETAGSKAPADVFKIAKSLGAKELIFEVVTSHKNVNVTRFFAYFMGKKNWKNVIKTVENDSWIIIQHPNENIMVANRYIDILKEKKQCHFIALVHDLDSVRQSFIYESEMLSKRNNLSDNILLKKCEYVICHNHVMKDYLINKGFEADKLIVLEIFDYIHNSDLPEKRKLSKSIVVAGNLMKAKCEYLYKLMEKDTLPFSLELFGPNFSKEIIPSYVTYHGVSKPEELPGKLEGAFGLVWDGTEINKCAGNAGEYIKYNNPHKCSLFLASNMPVIIWKEAALASFVLERGVGIVVDNLMDIGTVIDNLTVEEYEIMVENTKKVGNELRNGYYTKKALTAAVPSKRRI